MKDFLMEDILMKDILMKDILMKDILMASCTLFNPQDCLLTALSNPSADFLKRKYILTDMFRYQRFLLPLFTLFKQYGFFTTLA